VFAAASYVAGTARQSDLVTLRSDLGVLRDRVETVSQHADDAGRRALATHDAAALAYRAIAGELARGRATPTTRDRDQAVAETRFDRAIIDGLSPAAALREALR